MAVFENKNFPLILPPFHSESKKKKKSEDIKFSLAEVISVNTCVCVFLVFFPCTFFPQIEYI